MRSPRRRSRQDRTCSSAASDAAYAIGNTAFDANDHLALINLIDSYGYLADSFGSKRFGELFVDDATVSLYVDDRKIVGSLAQCKGFAQKRHDAFQLEHTQRRHILSAPRFDRQDAESASGQAYLQYYETRQGETPVVKFLGVYSFRAIKVDGLWKLACRIAGAD